MSFTFSYVSLLSSLARLYESRWNYMVITHNYVLPIQYTTKMENRFEQQEKQFRLTYSSFLHSFLR